MPSHKYIGLNDLSVDLAVQRIEGLDMRKVNRMAAAFDARALGAIVVSRRRDGRFIVLDGMHRVETARQVGYKGHILASVLEGLSPEDEHRLFVLYNTTTAVTPLTKFVQRVQYGDPVAVDINRIITSHGWAAKNGNADGYINAVQALEAVYLHGAFSVEPGIHPEILDGAIDIITAAWGLDWRGAHGVLVKGVGKFVGRWSEYKLDTKKVVAELQLITPYQLRGKAKSLTELMGGTQDAAVGRILTNLHNHKRRSNFLPEWVWTR